MIVKFKKLHPDAIIPSYKHYGDSGLSLCSIGDYKVELGETTKVHTGIVVEIPLNYEGQIRARSGLAAKYMITLVNSIGTIDSNYRGEIICLLTSFYRKGYYTIKKGDIIAQLVIAPVQIVEPIEIEDHEELTITNRGQDGFGSTGRS